MFKMSMIAFIIGITITIVAGFSLSNDEDNRVLFVLHDNNYKPKNPELQKEFNEWIEETDSYLKIDFKELNENIKLCKDLIKNNLFTENDKFECKDAISIALEYERFYKKSLSSTFEKNLKSCCKEEE